MKCFIDTADVAEIRSFANSGLLDGVTTDPRLIATSGRQLPDVIAEICNIVPGPVSTQVVGAEFHQIMAEAAMLRKIANNVAIKVPPTPDGLRACRHLRDDGAIVNVTLCFSAAQALLAAKAQASFVSLCIGPLDDTGWNGMELAADIVKIYRNYDFKTEVLIAAIHHPAHVLQAARLGAHVVAPPPAILRRLYNHPLTDACLDGLLADWAKSRQTMV